MRKYLIILFLMINLVLSANTYYVAVNGSDNNPGSKRYPWQSFHHAFNHVKAGDTVYFRGGIYYTSGAAFNDKGLAGTTEAPVCFFNYPGEIPVLDGINKRSPSSGMYFYYANNLILKGITIRNHRQLVYDFRYVFGIYFYKSNNITLENCIVHDIGFRGYYFYDCDTIRVYNCDAYNIVDSLSSTPGNAGDGFIMTGSNDWNDIYDYALFKGCRTWHCSDDGWDVHTEGYIEINDCWAFNCGGYPEYNYGTGFKLNLSCWGFTPEIKRRIINCLAAYNRGGGITTNDNTAIVKPMEIYNTTCAFNGIYGNISAGITIYNSRSPDEDDLLRVFKNNISFANTGGEIKAYGQYTHDNNSWDIPLLLTNSNFITTDSTGLSSQRKRNGDLPKLNFMQLKHCSKIKNIGFR